MLSHLSRLEGFCLHWYTHSLRQRNVIKYLIWTHTSILLVVHYHAFYHCLWKITSFKARLTTNAYRLQFTAHVSPSNSVTPQEADKWSRQLLLDNKTHTISRSLFSRTVDQISTSSLESDSEVESNIVRWRAHSSSSQLKNRDATSKASFAGSAQYATKSRSDHRLNYPLHAIDFVRPLNNTDFLLTLCFVCIPMHIAWRRRGCHQILASGEEQE